MIVLSPDIGHGSLPQLENVAATAKDIGLRYESIRLVDEHEWLKAHAERIVAVDFTFTRGCLTDFQGFERARNLANSALALRAILHNPLSTVTDWLVDKEIQHCQLKQQGVPVVPTRFVSARSDNFMTEARLAVLDALRMSSSIVLKPSMGALAARLAFLTKHQNYTVQQVIGPGDVGRTTFDSVTQLERWLEMYLLGLLSQNLSLQIQDFVDHFEISAVFINARPHFILRTVGEAGIAHQLFGGEDSFIQTPPAEVTRLCKLTLAALPDFVRRALCFRVDIFVDKSNGQAFVNEIEGAAGTRLWLAEAGRVNDYVEALSQRIAAA